jgi:hypothetical protein
MLTIYTLGSHPHAPQLPQLNSSLLKVSYQLAYLDTSYISSYSFLNTLRSSSNTRLLPIRDWTTCIIPVSPASALSSSTYIIALDSSTQHSSSTVE